MAQHFQLDKNSNYFAFKGIFKYYFFISQLLKDKMKYHHVIKDLIIFWVNLKEKLAQLAYLKLYF